MEFYISQTARQYSDLITEVEIATLSRVFSGFIPYVFPADIIERNLAHLPIFFVTTQDIDNTGKIPFISSSNREMEKIIFADDEDQLSEKSKSQAYDISRIIPSFFHEDSKELLTEVPDRQWFHYVEEFSELRTHLEDGHLEEDPYLRKEGFFHSILTGWGLKDHLGIFIESERFSENNKIFIWVDKILQEPHLKMWPVEGILYVVLHELAHALMYNPYYVEKDERHRWVHFNTFSNKIISFRLFEFFRHCQEEALANAIAHRTIRFKTQVSRKSRCFQNIEEFMHKQPIEYELGAVIAAEAKDSTLRSYIRKWTRLKGYHADWSELDPLGWLNAAAKPNWPLSDFDIKSLSRLINPW